MQNTIKPKHAVTLNMKQYTIFEAGISNTAALYDSIPQSLIPSRIAASFVLTRKISAKNPGRKAGRLRPLETRSPERNHTIRVSYTASRFT